MDITLSRPLSRSITVTPVSLSQFNLGSVFSLNEYGNLAEISCPVHTRGIASFSHLFVVLKNRQRPHMYVQEQDVRTVHVNFVNNVNKIIV